MQYLLLIYDDERAWGARSADERGAMMQEYLAYGASLREAGAYVDGNALADTTEASTVSVRDGEELVTDRRDLLCADLHGGGVMPQPGPDAVRGAGGEGAGRAHVLRFTLVMADVDADQTPRVEPGGEQGEPRGGPGDHAGRPGERAQSEQFAVYHGREHQG